MDAKKCFIRHQKMRRNLKSAPLFPNRKPRFFRQNINIWLTTYLHLVNKKYFPIRIAFFFDSFKTLATTHFRPHFNYLAIFIYKKISLQSKIHMLETS